MPLPPLRLSSHGARADGYIAGLVASPPLPNITPDAAPNVTETTVLDVPVGEAQLRESVLALVWRAQGESVGGGDVEADVRLYRRRNAVLTPVGTTGGAAWQIGAAGKTPGVGMGTIAVPEQTYLVGDDIVLRIQSSRTAGADAVLAGVAMLVQTFDRV